MKCVKNPKTGIIHRLSNEEAAHYVSKGEGKYVPKSEWKTILRAEAEAEINLDRA